MVTPLKEYENAANSCRLSNRAELLSELWTAVWSGLEVWGIFFSSTSLGSLVLVPGRWQSAIVAVGVRGVTFYSFLSDHHNNFRYSSY